MNTKPDAAAQQGARRELPVIELVRCVRCGLPETYETIEFDDRGVCNVCRQKEYKDERIDWTARKRQLDQLVESHRGQHPYDCIIPFSGGKDSTFTLLYMVKEYGVKPLVVQFNHGFLRPNLLRNNDRTFRALGVEVLSFTPNWRVVKRVMLEALVRKGDFCWHCHTGIFAYPMHVALPAGHRLATKPKLRLADLRNESWIQTSAPTPCARHVVRSCHEAGFEPTVSFGRPGQLPGLSPGLTALAASAPCVQRQYEGGGADE